jgi:hypothetical protein
MKSSTETDLFERPWLEESLHMKVYTIYQILLGRTAKIIKAYCKRKHDKRDIIR